MSTYGSMYGSQMGEPPEEKGNPKLSYISALQGKMAFHLALVSAKQKSYFEEGDSYIEKTEAVNRDISTRLKGIIGDFSETFTEPVSILKSTDLDSGFTPTPDNSDWPASYSQRHGFYINNSWLPARDCIAADFPHSKETLDRRRTQSETKFHWIDAEAKPS